jgi:hypothetical protein
MGQMRSVTSVPKVAVNGVSSPSEASSSHAPEPPAPPAPPDPPLPPGPSGSQPASSRADASVSADDYFTYLFDEAKKLLQAAGAQISDPAVKARFDKAAEK